MSSNKKIILIVGFVLLVGCCGLGWIANLSNTSSPKATQTATVSQTAPTSLPSQAAVIQPTATQVATATFTPVPPTSTPAPTNTPAPTATEAPTSTPNKTEIAASEILDYTSNVVTYSTMLAGDMTHFSNLNKDAGANPALLLDTTWDDDVRSTLADMVDYSNMLSKMNPVPDKMKPVQYWLNKLGPEMESLQSDYLYGLENLDDSSINKALQHLQNYTKYMSNATDEVSKLKP